MDPAVWKELPQEQKDMILDAPATEAPLGEDHNLENPPNNDTLVVAAVATCVAFSALFTLVRIYTRIWSPKVVAVSDAFGIVAFGLYTGVAWGILESVNRGAFFVHEWDITLRTLISVLFPYWIIPFLYVCSMLFLKAAILLDWIRLFVPGYTKNKMYWACVIVLAINTGFYIAGIFVMTLSCRPITRTWEPLSEGTCMNRRNYDFTSACINLVMDIIILIIPQGVIWKLQMTFKKKLGIGFLFSVGILGCVCAAGRVGSGSQLLESKDRSYDSAPPALWAFAELTCGLLIFCIPAAPKAVTENAAISQIIASVRSWTRIGADNHSSNSLQRPGQVYIGSSNAPPMPPGSIPLTESKQSLRKTSRSTEGEDLDADYGGIKYTRTTTVTEGQRVRTADNEHHNRQHPWRTQV